jgi:hypothetical protein
MGCLSRRHKGTEFMGMEDILRENVTYLRIDDLPPRRRGAELVEVEKTHRQHVTQFVMVGE